MITDKQVEAGIAAAKNCPKAAAIYLMDDELKALARAALEAAEAAAWSRDLSAAPKKDEVVMESDEGVTGSFWRQSQTDDGEGYWTDGFCELKNIRRWRPLPTPPTEGDR